MTVKPGDRLWQMPFAAALACLVAFFYGLYALRLQAPQPVRTLPPASFDYVVFDAVVIGIFVGMSLAQALLLEKAYWVPGQCGGWFRPAWRAQAPGLDAGGGSLAAVAGVHRRPSLTRLGFLLVLNVFLGVTACCSTQKGICHASVRHDYR